MTANNPQALKPCPFCGNKVGIHVVFRHWYSGQKEFLMQCFNCSASYGSIGFNAVDGNINRAREYLINEWNTRKESK